MMWTESEQICFYNICNEVYIGFVTDMALSGIISGTQQDY